MVSGVTAVVVRASKEKSESPVAKQQQQKKPKKKHTEQQQPQQQPGIHHPALSRVLTRGRFTQLKTSKAKVKKTTKKERKHRERALTLTPGWKNQHFLEV